VSYAAQALNDVIDTAYGGSRTALAEACGLSKSTITKLTKNQIFTKPTLEAICGVLSREDGEKLCLAVCLDQLPSEFAQGLCWQGAKAGSTQLHPTVDRLSEQILIKIAELAAKESETKAWLHRIGSWLGVEESTLSYSLPQPQQLKVAEDRKSYGKSKKDK